MLRLTFAYLSLWTWCGTDQISKQIFFGPLTHRTRKMHMHAHDWTVLSAKNLKQLSVMFYFTLSACGTPRDRARWLGSIACTVWRMAMDQHTLVYDQVKLSWSKVIEWCHGSVDPTKTWWQADLDRIYVTKIPSDSKEISKSLHKKLTLDVWVFPTSS